jgi:hypothetical protein
MNREFTQELEENINCLKRNEGKCKLDQAALNQISSENEKISYLEATFEDWLNYFRSKLDKDNFVQKKVVNEGPKTEMIFWKNVLQEIFLLFDLTRS